MVENNELKSKQTERETCFFFFSTQGGAATIDGDEIVKLEELAMLTPQDGIWLKMQYIIKVRRYLRYTIFSMLTPV